MFNLAEIWNYTDSRIKFLFWLAMGVYFIIPILMFVVIGYDQGYVVTWTIVKPNLLFVMKIFAIWPTLPLLVTVYLNGYCNYKLAMTNPENMQA